MSPNVHLKLVTDDAQGADGVVKSPEAIIVIKDLEDAAEREGEPEEHDAVLTTSLVGALQQPEAVLDQVSQGVVRHADDAMMHDTMMHDA